MKIFFIKKMSIIFFIFVPIIFLWHPNWLGFLGVQPYWPLFWLLPWSMINGSINGLLVGIGDDYPNLILYSKNADLKVGDFVSSSPASSLLPPNIPIGIVQSIDEPFKTKKMAKISLLAKPHAIDWVQILKVKI